MKVLDVAQSEDLDTPTGEPFGRVSIHLVHAFHVVRGSKKSISKRCFFFRVDGNRRG